MSDDLSNKIKQITDILGQENLPDNLKGLLALLAGPSSSNQEPSSNKPEIPVAREKQPERNELDENWEMMQRIKKLMDRASPANDPRVNLLSAIKPFLNSTRQRKLNGCIRILQMSSLVRYLEENGK